MKKNTRVKLASSDLKGLIDEIDVSKSYLKELNSISNKLIEELDDAIQQMSSLERSENEVGIFDGIYRKYFSVSNEAIEIYEGTVNELETLQDDLRDLMDQADLNIKEVESALDNAR